MRADISAGIECFRVVILTSDGSWGGFRPTLS